MVDKGLNIKKECDVHVIDVHVPHVPRGQLQILRKDLRKQMTFQNWVLWLNK